MSLKDAALKVRENAHAPYSRFKVGAAIRGAATTGDKPKGDRVTFQWHDEMAIQDKAMETWEAAADTAEARTDISHFSARSSSISSLTTSWE